MLIPAVIWEIHAWKIPSAVKSLHWKTSLAGTVDTISARVPMVVLLNLAAQQPAVSLVSERKRKQQIRLTTSLLALGISVFTNVVYNGSSGFWACCRNTGQPNPEIDCSNPTRESFSAPAPDKLLTIANSTLTASSDVATSVRTVSIVVTPSNATPSLTSTSLDTGFAALNPTLGQISTSILLPSESSCSNGRRCSSHLSMGTSAGIGAGATIAGFAFIATTALLVRRAIKKRNPRSRRTFKSDAGNTRQASPYRQEGDVPELGMEQDKELDGTGFVEMEERNRLELGL